MDSFLKILVKSLIIVTLVVSCSAPAATKEIDDAVKQYYAGFPDKAISMVKPLALAGDVEAQFLLGNILYSLSQTEKYSFHDESIMWYRMAAEKDFAPANYAIAVIFENKWLNSKNKEDAATAIIYYQKAVNLGYTKAEFYLEKMKSRSGISQKEAAALTQEQEAKSVSKSEFRAEASDKEKDNVGSADAITSVDGSNSTNIAKKTETVKETRTVSENLNRSAPIADNPDNLITITLGDIASQCQNYTATGFALYAETIKGSLLSGNALMVSLSPDSSEPGAFSVDLANSQFDSAVLVNLRKVPEEVARVLIEGDKYAVTGIVVDSKLVGSGCALSAIYQSIEG